MKDLETERLTLRMYTLEDAQGLYDYASNPNVGPHAGWKPHESVEESAGIIATLFAPAESWAIRLKGEERIIGTIGLEPDRHRDENSREIGYSLAEDQWGKGLMTEICTAFVKHLFDMGFNKVFINAAVDNIGSNRVIEKCGFKFIGKEKLEHTSVFKPEPMMINCYEMNK